MNNATQKQAWLNFVNASVTRYKDKIAVWEIWNEPNANTYWGNSNYDSSISPFGGDPDEYAQLFIETSILIHEVDPTAQVMTGGLFGTDCRYLYRLYENGIGPYADCIGVHPYGGGYLPNSMATAYGELPATSNVTLWTGGYNPVNVPVLTKFTDIPELFGYNMSFWITECSDWRSIQDTHYAGSIDDFWSEGIPIFYNLIKDQNIDWTWAQDFLNPTKNNLGDFRVICFFAYTLNDGDGNFQGGLVESDGTIHPQYYVYQALCRKYNLGMSTQSTNQLYGVPLSEWYSYQGIAINIWLKIRGV
jgi:hypothetical protein